MESIQIFDRFGDSLTVEPNDAGVSFLNEERSDIGGHYVEIEVSREQLPYLIAYLKGIV